jgi:hypothetical protein
MVAGCVCARANAPSAAALATTSALASFAPLSAPLPLCALVACAEGGEQRRPVPTVAQHAGAARAGGAAAGRKGASAHPRRRVSHFFAPP